MIIKPIENLDEIWNYNSARAITQGLLPYTDISMITTPLLCVITAIPLQLIANEVMVSRIVGALLCTGVLFLVFKILNYLIKEENASLICTSLIGILCRDIYCLDYNLMVLLIALIILYQELKNISKTNLKNDFVVRVISRFSNLHKAKYWMYACFYCCYL